MAEGKKLKLSDKGRIVISALFFFFVVFCLLGGGGFLPNRKITPFGNKMHCIFQTVYPPERNTVSFFPLLLAS